MSLGVIDQSGLQARHGFLVHATNSNSASHSILSVWLTAIFNTSRHNRSSNRNIGPDDFNLTTCLLSVSVPLPLSASMHVLHLLQKHKAPEFAFLCNLGITILSMNVQIHLNHANRFSSKPLSSLWSTNCNHGFATELN